MEKYPKEVIKAVTNAVIGMYINNVDNEYGCEGFRGWCEDGDMFYQCLDEEKAKMATELMEEIADKVDDLTYGWLNIDGFGKCEEEEGR